jgi:hypothetical protein
MTYISSQRYLHSDIVQEKKEILNGCEFVEIPCSYVGWIDDVEYAMVNDRHHTLQAAKELSLEIIFKVAEDSENLTGNELLEARYIDSAYYNIETGRDEF